MTASAIMLTLGLGLGMVMQVLVIAVQNAVSYEDLGVATSGATLFRLIGGSLGTAVLGAVFAKRLAANLAGALPSGAAGMEMSAGGMSARALAAMPPDVRAAYALAFTRSLDTVFLVAMGIAAVGFVLVWLMPEQPLRKTVAAAAGDSGTQSGGTFARPQATDSASELLRGLSLLTSRDVQREFIEGMVARAGLSFSPVATWLLVKLEQNPALDVIALGARQRVPADQMRAAEAELRDAGLITNPRRRRDDARALTPAGYDTLNRLVQARREHIQDFIADWPATRREDTAAFFRSLAKELVPNVEDGTRASTAGSVASPATSS
jgi:hypothetical protein